MKFGNITVAKLDQFYFLFEDMVESRTNCLEIVSPLSKNISLKGGLIISSLK